MPSPLVPLMLALAQAAPMAPAGPPACAAPVAPPGGMEGWSKMAPVAAAVRAGEVGKALLPIGSSARATLLPIGQIDFALPPARTPAAESGGGLFGFAVTTPGRYRVALGSAAWIDVVRNGRSLPSVAHGHGPACSGIRKMVDFDLQPGRYLLQIAGSEPLATGVMVSAVPK